MRQPSGPIRKTEWPSVSEAARRLACRPALLRSAIAAGEIEVYRLGDRWGRVHWPAVLGWVRSKAVRPTAHAAARLREVLEREHYRDHDGTA